MPKEMPFETDEKKKKDEEEAKKAKDDEKPEMEKNKIDPSDLGKALDVVEALAKSGKSGRRSELLQKALALNTSEAENLELAKIVAGSAGTLASDIVKSMDPADSENLKKGFEVSPFLDDLHGKLTGCLESLAKSVERADETQELRSAALAKGVLEIGKLAVQTASLVKSLEARLDQWGRTPERGPKAAQSPQAFVKAGNGQPPQSTMQLSKNQVLDSLEELMGKSMADGRKGYSRSSEDINLAIAKYEQTNLISQPLLAEVLEQRKGNRA